MLGVYSGVGVGLVAAIYAMFLIGGFFYPVISKFMVLLLLVFFLTYYIACRALNKRTRHQLNFFILRKIK